MPERVPNGFSWSASRDNQFRNCPRAYFYHYYLALGHGIDADADRAREARRLRSMTTLPMWIGSHVHDAIEGLLRLARTGQPAHAAKAADRMVQAMRHDYRESMENVAARSDPRRHTRFHEHEYGIRVPDAQWKRAVDEAVEMLTAFARLEYLDTIRELEPQAVLGLEDLQKWSFENVPIWVRIDLAYRDPGGTIHIVDWKTGRVVRDDNPLQLMGYAAYAERAWDATHDDLAVREVYLRNDPPEKACEVDPAGLEHARRTIRTSVADMLGLLDDPSVNRASESSFATKPDERKCARCFFRGLCPDAAA